MQKYGRSVEILVLLKRNLPPLNIALTKDMKKAMLKVMDYTDWISEANYNELAKLIVSCKSDLKDSDIILTSDTHLEKNESIRLAQEIYAKGGLIISTGRKKKGTHMAFLLDNNKAVSFPYPHHASRLDAENLVKENQFEVVLPFHTDTKEVWFSNK